MTDYTVHGAILWVWRPVGLAAGVAQRAVRGVHRQNMGRWHGPWVFDTLMANGAPVVLFGEMTGHAMAVPRAAPSGSVAGGFGVLVAPQT